MAHEEYESLSPNAGKRTSGTLGTARLLSASELYSE